MAYVRKYGIRKRKPIAKHGFTKKSSSAFKKASHIRTKRTFHRKSYARSKAITDATVAPIVNMIHGKPYKVNPRFAKLVRECTSNVNTWQLRSSGVYQTTGFGNCLYSISNCLYDAADLSTIRTLILNNSASTSVRYTVADVELQVTLVNASSSSAWMRVYECEAREDIPLNSVYSTAIGYLYQGFTDAGFANNNIDPAGTAFQSPSFTAKFKISKVKILQFRPGETRKLVLRDNRPFVVNTSRYYTGQTGVGGGSIQQLLGPRGRYRFLLYQQWGGVIDDSVTTTNVNFDKSKIDYINLLKYNYKWTNDTTNNITNAGGFGTVTVAQEVNDLTGAVQTTAQA